MFFCRVKIDAMITVYSYRSVSTPLRTFPNFVLAWLKGNERSADCAQQTRFIDAETASHPVFA